MKDYYTNETTWLVVHYLGSAVKYSNMDHSSHSGAWLPRIDKKEESVQLSDILRIYWKCVKKKDTRKTPYKIDLRVLPKLLLVIDTDEAKSWVDEAHRELRTPKYDQRKSSERISEKDANKFEKKECHEAAISFMLHEDDLRKVKGQNMDHKDTNNAISKHGYKHYFKHLHFGATEKLVCSGQIIQLCTRTSRLVKHLRRQEYLS